MLKASFRSPGRRGFNLKSRYSHLKRVDGTDEKRVVLIFCFLPLSLHRHPAVVLTAGEAFPAERSLQLIWLQEEFLGYVHNAIHLDPKAQEKKRRIPL